MQIGHCARRCASPAIGEKRVPTWVGGRPHSRSRDRCRPRPCRTAGPCLSLARSGSCRHRGPHDRSCVPGGARLAIPLAMLRSSRARAISDDGRAIGSSPKGSPDQTCAGGTRNAIELGLLSARGWAGASMRARRTSPAVIRKGFPDAAPVATPAGGRSRRKPSGRSRSSPSLSSPRGPRPAAWRSRAHRPPRSTPLRCGSSLRNEVAGDLTVLC